LTLGTANQFPAFTALYPGEKLREGDLCAVMQ